MPSAGGTPTRGVDSPGGVRGNTPIDPSEAIGWAVVKYNYQAQQMDELSLVKGGQCVTCYLCVVGGVCNVTCVLSWHVYCCVYCSVV